MERTETSTAPVFADLNHYAGFDWGRDKHQIVVVDREGRLWLDLAFEDTAVGWASVREKLAAFPRLGVAIETRCGPAVERLLEAGLSVYPLNPKAAERYRDRKAPSGGKSDRLDARSFADALRTDGHAWRPLLPQDPLTQELRLLCRDEIGLIEQRTALVNQIQEALHEYYPAALQAFDDWTAPSAWDFILTFPTPQALISAGKRKWEKFLHTHKLYRPTTANLRLEVFAAAGQFVNPNSAVTSAKSFLAVALARQLRLLENQLNEYRQRIAKLFNDHPDRDIFGSLPGAGPKLAPRLLAECGDNRAEFDSPQALQCYAGTAPVSFQSGRMHRVRVRRACNHWLRATVHLWADQSRRLCAWAEAYYQQKKNQGMAHAAALRCLGNRWLKILWRVWQDGVSYDEALHLRNQVAHGSWVIALMPEAAGNSTSKPKQTPKLTGSSKTHR
jgi:transposase